MRFLFHRNDLEGALSSKRAMDRLMDRDDIYDVLFPVDGLSEQELCRIFVAHQAWKYFRSKSEESGCPLVLHKQWTYKTIENKDNPLRALTWMGKNPGPGKGSKLEFREAIRNLAFAIALRTPQIALEDLFDNALNDKQAFWRSLRSEVRKFFEKSLKPLFIEKEPYRIPPFLVETETEEEDISYEGLEWKKRAFTKNEVLAEIEAKIGALAKNIAIS